MHRKRNSFSTEHVILTMILAPDSIQVPLPRLYLHEKTVMLHLTACCRPKPNEHAMPTWAPSKGD